MVPERIPGTLTAGSSSPMDSCGRVPICQPSEPRFLSPKASFTDHHYGVDAAPQWKLHYPNGAAIRKVDQKRSRGKLRPTFCTYRRQLGSQQRFKSATKIADSGHASQACKQKKSGRNERRILLRIRFRLSLAPLAISARTRSSSLFAPSRFS
jgi:hypothetical protein